MTAYYNEIDPYCAAWLQNLMDAGHIAPGVIDTRSIEDVRPDELAGYTQCHFFAGIGVWSLALRAAGWPDSRPAWTGSCPCQPFSAAGKGAGFADERHLWPAWQHLINQCRPPVLFGEQVASKDAEPWIDLVHADLEGMGYAFGCVPFPSAGVGAPHIRDRNYWVGVGLADANHPRLEGRELSAERAAEFAAGPGGMASWLANAAQCGRGEECPHDGRCLVGDSAQGLTAGLVHGVNAGRLAHADGRHASAERQQRSGEQRQQPQDGGVVRLADSAGEGRRSEWPHGDAAHGIETIRAGQAESGRRGAVDAEGAGPTNGFWRAADWLRCTDGKWRPVEPGTFPLAHGASIRVGRMRADQERLAANVPRKDQGSRTGRLRAYGNAISAQAAKAFIESYCEARGLILVPIEAAA